MASERCTVRCEISRVLGRYRTAKASTKLILLLAPLILIAFSVVAFAEQRTWSSDVDFATGTHTNTTNQSGTLNISYFNELPNDMGGDDLANMTGNVLLFHFNNDSSYGENSTHVYDFSGNGSNGTLVANTKYNWSHTKFGNSSIELDGSGDYVNIAQSSSLNDMSAITIGAWVKTADGDDYNFIVESYNEVGAQGYTLYSNYGKLCLHTGAGSDLCTNISYNNDTWRYLAVTNDGTTSTIYVDGVSIVSSSPGSNFGWAEDVQIGCRATSYCLKGLIDELAIWNRSLSATEILNIYERNKTHHKTGSYLSNTTTETNVVENITATWAKTSLDYSNLWTSDADWNTGDLNISGRENNSVNVTGNDLVLGNESGGAQYFANGSYESNTTTLSQNVTEIRPIWSTEANAELPDDMLNQTSPGINMTGNVLLLHFNNASTVEENSTHAYDWSGNDNNGTFVGNTKYNWSHMKFGNSSIEFDGTGDYVNAGTDTSFDFGNNGSFTAMAWVNPNNFDSEYQAIIGKIPIPTGASQYQWMLTLQSDAQAGRVGLYSNDNGWQFSDVVGISAGTWYHVALGFNGTHATFYVNGTNKGMVTFGYTDYAAYYVTAGKWYTTSDIYDYDGLIDEVALWNRTLSATEILDIYKRGSTNASIEISPDDGATWTYVDTNNNASTYNFTAAAGNNKLAYRVNLSTENTSYTPQVHDINLTYKIDDVKVEISANSSIFQPVINGTQYNFSGNNYNTTYRVNFTTDDSSRTPKLHDLTLDYDVASGDTTLPNVTFSFPANGSINGSTDMYFGFTPTDDTALGNATLWINLSGTWQANNSNTSAMSNNTLTTILLENIPNGSYIWNINISDATGNWNYNYSTNFTLTVDSADPEVTLNFPTNLSVNNTNDIYFGFTPRDSITYLTNATLWINLSGTWQFNNSNSSALSNNTLTTISVDNIPDGTYIWNINVTDSVGNWQMNESNFTLTIDTNTSLKGAKFNVSDFSFASSSYVTGIIEEFNTTSTNTELVLFTTFNILKLTGGASNDIWVKVTVNETKHLEEKVRTVSGLNDEGSSGTSPVEFSVPNGEHNITIDFRRTGQGSIQINDIDIVLIEFESVQGGTVRDQLTSDFYEHTSTGFVSGYNITVEKEKNASTFTILKATLNNSQAATMDYYIENLNSSETSPYWSRYISSGTDTGSVSANWINDYDENMTYTLQSKTDSGTAGVNFTVVDFSLVDSDDLAINHFNSSNYSTNLTDSISLTAGTYRITNKTVTVENGTAYFLTFMGSFKSQSGAQTPYYFVNSTEIDESNCYSKKERKLSSNNDVGNIFITTICEGLTTESSYAFNVYLVVPSGETVQQLDECLGGFEVTNFTVSEINSPPIPDEITVPTNNTYVGGAGRNVTWNNFTDPNDNLNSFNITLRNQDFTVVDTINDSSDLVSILSTPIDYSSYSDGVYLITVEGCDTDSECSTENATITIDNTAPTITLNSPGDLTYNNTDDINFQFYCNETYILTEAQLWTNISGTWANNVSNTSEVNNNTLETISLTDIDDGSYVWNINCTDEVSNNAFASSNNSLTIDTVNPSISNIVANGTYVNKSINISITYTITESHLDQVWCDRMGTNYTGTSTGCTVDSGTTEGNVSVNITVNDSAGNAIMNKETWFVIDTVAPPVDLLSPPNASYNSSDDIRFQWEVNESNIITNCTLWTNISGTWAFNSSNTSTVGNNSVNTIVFTDIDDGSYIWNVNCSDTANNTAFYETGNFTLTVDTIYPNYTSAAKSPTGDVNVKLTEEFSVTAKDNHLEYVYLEHGLTTGTKTNYTMVAEGDRYEYNWTSTNVGGYSYRFIQEDKADNINSTSSTTYSVTISAGISGGGGGAGGPSGVLVCGNNICEYNEDYRTCPEDCPEPVIEYEIEDLNPVFTTESGLVIYDQIIVTSYTNKSFILQLQVDGNEEDDLDNSNEWFYFYEREQRDDYIDERVKQFNKSFTITPNEKGAILYKIEVPPNMPDKRYIFNVTTFNLGNENTTTKTIQFELWLGSAKFTKYPLSMMSEPIFTFPEDKICWLSDPLTGECMHPVEFQYWHAFLIFVGGILATVGYKIRARKRRVRVHKLPRVYR